MKKLAFVLLAGLLAGCATTPKLATPSGRPEVQITGVTEGQIRGILLQQLLPRGWRVAQNAPGVLRLDIEAGAGLSLLWGSLYDPRAYHRLDFSFAELPGGSVRVFLSSDLVANRGSSVERTTETKGSWDHLQKLLENVKAEAEGEPLPHVYQLPGASGTSAKSDPALTPPRQRN